MDFCNCVFNWYERACINMRNIWYQHYSKLRSRRWQHKSTPFLIRSFTQMHSHYKAGHRNKVYSGYNCVLWTKLTLSKPQIIYYVVFVVVTLPIIRIPHFEHFKYTNKTCQTFFCISTKKHFDKNKGGIKKGSFDVLDLNITTLTKHWKHFIIS